MAQFRASPGVTYKNIKTGQTVTYTAAQLQNDATGWLTSDWQPAQTAAPKPTVAPTVKPAATTPTTPATTTSPYFGIPAKESAGMTYEQAVARQAADQAAKAQSSPTLAQVAPAVTNAPSASTGYNAPLTSTAAPKPVVIPGAPAVAAPPAVIGGGTIVGGTYTPAAYTPTSYQPAVYQAGEDIFKEMTGRAPETQDERDLIAEYNRIYEQQKANPPLTGKEGALAETSEAVEAYSKPNVFLAFLKAGLRTKLKPEEQQLGQSALFQKAGLTGMPTLFSSLSARTDQIIQNGADLAAVLDSAGGIYMDYANMLQKRYDRIYTEHQQLLQRQYTLEDDYRDFTKQLAMLQETNRMNQKMALYNAELQRLSNIDQYNAQMQQMGAEQQYNWQAQQQGQAFDIQKLNAQQQYDWQSQQQQQAYNAQQAATQQGYNLQQQQYGQQLTNQELQYRAQLDQATGQTSIPTQTVETNGHLLLINSNTGETIRDLGATDDPTKTIGSADVGYWEKDQTTGEWKNIVPAEPSANETKPMQIGEDAYGNKTYGVYDAATQTIQPVGVGASGESAQPVQTISTAANPIRVPDVKTLQDYKYTSAEVTKKADGSIVLNPGVEARWLTASAGGTQAPATTKAEQELVTAFIKKYPDAGITMTDTLAQAQAKLPKSRIYAEEVRTKTGTGGSGSTGDDYNSQMAALVASKGSDGYVNTDVYKQLRNRSKDKTSFDKNFSYLLNPNDPTAKEFMSKKTVSEWTPAIEQQFLNMGIDQATLDAAKAAGVKPDELF